mgnify:CR=1 FL=1
MGETLRRYWHPIAAADQLARDSEQQALDSQRSAQDINIGAGFIIGVLQKGMPMGEAAKIYTILTVGDGLVGAGVGDGGERGKSAERLAGIRAPTGRRWGGELRRMDRRAHRHPGAPFCRCGCF